MGLPLPIPTANALPQASSEWKLASLAGRLVELSGAGDGAALTMAFGLVREAQLLEEPVAWISLSNHCFYPPDVAAGGVDLRALAVVRVTRPQALARAADHLARSGAFGLIVLDVPLDATGGFISMAVQSRLLGLARKHEIAMLFLTQKSDRNPSLGSLVSLRGQTHRTRSGELDRYLCNLSIIKDKRRAPGWNHTEVCCGPAGLH